VHWSRSLPVFLDQRLSCAVKSMTFFDRSHAALLLVVLVSLRSSCIEKRKATREEVYIVLLA
jgi:hypothetical protein